MKQLIIFVFVVSLACNKEGPVPQQISFSTFHINLQINSADSSKNRFIASLGAVRKGDKDYWSDSHLYDVREVAFENGPSTCEVQWNEKQQFNISYLFPEDEWGPAAFFELRIVAEHTSPQILSASLILPGDKLIDLTPYLIAYRDTREGYRRFQIMDTNYSRNVTLDGHPFSFSISLTEFE